MPGASRFQHQFLIAAIATAVAALALAGALFATSMRRQVDEGIESTLVKQARLSAELLARGTTLTTVAQLDEEADRIGGLIGARVTFIAADGRVVGDSSEPLDAIPAMENHAQRPEVIEARSNGLGKARRHSDTVNIDMLYVAIPISHPSVAFVRVALPLSDVREQLQTVLSATLMALSVALAVGATIAWMMSR